MTQSHSPTTSRSELLGCFESLATEARELYLTEEVPILHKPPTPLQFYRSWVCPNKPVIIKNAVGTWPALKKWSLSYLKEKFPKKIVSVAATPNGLADAVFKGHFVLPEERRMTFKKFTDLLINGNGRDQAVYYIQKQDSNLTKEFPELLEDVCKEISWATQAFDKTPDAVNLWIGNKDSISSMHKDHFENLYVVICGAKHFTLHPPTDQPFIPYENYPLATYKEIADGKFEIVPSVDGSLVKWIPIDPDNPDLAKWPLYAKTKAIRCTLYPGDMLYLPSMWYHHVSQENETIAVNYWYDMEFDIKFNYFQFVEKLTQTMNAPM